MTKRNGPSSVSLSCAANSSRARVTDGKSSRRGSAVAPLATTQVALPPVT